MFKSNEQGICPRCNGTDLDYEKPEFDGDFMYFRFHCENCGEDSAEYYAIEFISHRSEDENGDIVEVSNYV